MKHALSILILSASLTSCTAIEDFWGAADCDDNQDSAISKYGRPDDVDTASGDGYSSETYYWWTSGRSESFTWGDNYDNCETFVFTFTPF